MALSYCVSSYLMIYDFPALGAVAAAFALGAAGRVSIPARIVAWTAYATPLVQFATGWTIAPLGSLGVLAFAAIALRQVFAPAPEPGYARNDALSRHDPSPMK